MINRVARQQEGMAQELKSISRALTEIAEQRKDIEHLLEHQRDHRSWMKNHEERIQIIEKVQASCPGADLTELEREVKALRQTPGDKALNFLYAILLLGIGAAFTWLSRGGN